MSAFCIPDLNTFRFNTEINGKDIVIIYTTHRLTEKEYTVQAILESNKDLNLK